MTARERFPLEVVEELDSTSSELIRRAVAGPHGSVALLARRQTGGRGRLGRSWQSFEGNLHLSVSFGLLDQLAAGHWSLLAAVALLDALRKFAPDQLAFSLKWPNDVLLYGRKLAGILLKLVPDPEGKFRLVIGFGVNLAVAPADMDRPVICLADIGTAVEIEAVA